MASSQRALCRLAVIRTLMTKTGVPSSTRCLLMRPINTINNSTATASHNQRLWQQPYSSYSTSKSEPSAVIFNVQDSDDFDKRVLKSDVPTLVDFHAGWCNPCKMLGPRLEKIVAATEGKVQLAKVDVDDNADLAIDYDVTSIPMVLAMKDGKVADQFIGLMEVNQLEQFVEKLY